MAVIVHYRRRGSGLVNNSLFRQSRGRGLHPARAPLGDFSMNTKMKVLALALVGLAGYAGSAVAGCPGSPVPPWTANAPFQGTTTIVAGGLDGSACRLDSTISAGATGFANAVVQDDTPAAEPRYRAQFMINVAGLAAPTLITTANVFSATSGTSGNGINLGIFGDGS